MPPLLRAWVRPDRRAGVVGAHLPDPDYVGPGSRLQVVETLWSIRANHGGGYQYRLCPLEDTLTEECFKKMPMVREGIVSCTLLHSRLNLPPHTHLGY